MPKILSDFSFPLFSFSSVFDTNQMNGEIINPFSLNGAGTPWSEKGSKIHTWERKSSIVVALVLALTLFIFVARVNGWKNSRQVTSQNILHSKWLTMSKGKVSFVVSLCVELGKVFKPVERSLYISIVPFEIWRTQCRRTVVAIFVHGPIIYCTLSDSDIVAAINTAPGLLLLLLLLLLLDENALCWMQFDLQEYVRVCMPYACESSVEPFFCQPFLTSASQASFSHTAICHFNLSFPLSLFHFHFLLFPSDGDFLCNICSNFFPRVS